MKTPSFERKLRPSNPKLYMSDEEMIKHERFFFKHHWDPEKTVDEEEMKARFGQEWYKDYEYRYDAI